MNKNWKNNKIQFPRLIAEINANVKISRNDWKSLCESMGLSEGDVQSLFDRAENEWEKIKAKL